jgi:tetratricopeptide (TPR) repeat protein/transcriptional regulator with XRE-family HTH domain
VAGGAGLDFAGLLRQLRAAARLTQEELAEAAGISTRAVSDLERGVNRTAHKDTARLLAAALGLDGHAGERFVAAARGRAPASEVLTAPQTSARGTVAAAATRALPRDIASFIGREGELARLFGVIDTTAASSGVVGIYAIDGMAGIGKTTLAVHAAHRLAERFPDGQIFLPLHAHARGQRPVDPAEALVSLLLTAGVNPHLIPPGLEARAVRWRDHVAGKRILLILDDAVSHEQVAPLLPGTAGSLVLVTSRRRLAALQDATVISLDILPHDAATELLVRLADRSGIGAGDAAAGEITRLCGYLPLAIGMLAAQLRHHPAWTLAQLAAELSQARDRLTLMHAENVSVTAAFDLSYQELTPCQQRLFRRLGLVPGASIDVYAAAALDSTSLQAARGCLDELYDQHLLTEPAPGRYQLHDLLREHAHTLAAADDPADADAAAKRLLDYYLHTAAAANRLTAERQPPAIPFVACPPAAAPQLASQKEALAWLETERANLQACAGYAAAHGLAMPAVWLPAQLGDFLRRHGYLDQAVALHQAAAEIAEAAGDRAGQAAALNNLGYIYRLVGQYTAAISSLTPALSLYRDLGNQTAQVDALNLLGAVHNEIDDLPAAAAAAAEALSSARAAGDKSGEAHALATLATAQQGDIGYRAATEMYSQALALLREAGDQHGLARTLTVAGITQKWVGDYGQAVSSFTEAAALSRELGDPLYEGLALIRLGNVHRVTGDYQAAAAAVNQGLALVQELGSQSWVAEAVQELGALQYLTGDHQTAATSLTQALTMHRELGARWGEAEILNLIGELQATTLGPEEGIARYTEALTIARDIPASEMEADALTGIGRCHLQTGNTTVGTALLRQALDIYQRIGSPSAQHIREILDEHPTTQSTPARRHGTELRTNPDRTQFQRPAKGSP